MTLDFRLNGLGFEIGEQLDAGKLGQARCKKAGFLQRRIVGTPPGQRLFFAKNPVLSCFHSGVFQMGPQLELRPDTDRMWGTSAYLFYTGSRLVRVTFQLIGSVSESSAAATSFIQLANTAFGAAALSWARLLRGLW